MNRLIIFTAAVLGMLAVIAGAFGAHTLKELINAQQLEIWHKGVEYQFYHVLALLFLSTFSRPNSRVVKASYFFFTFGIIFFSGSLYTLACFNMLTGDWLYYMGPITPFGGLLLILGWLMLAIAAIRNK